jgi:hypothetical protein
MRIFSPRALLWAKRSVGLVAGLTLVAAWFYSGYLEQTYVSYPQSPDPAKGLIVAFPVKNIIVYITQEQRGFLALLTKIEVGSAVVIALVFLMHGGDPFRRNRQ